MQVDMTQVVVKKCVGQSKGIAGSHSGLMTEVGESGLPLTLTVSVSEQMNTFCLERNMAHHDATYILQKKLIWSAENRLASCLVMDKYCEDKMSVPIRAVRNSSRNRFTWLSQNLSSRCILL